MADLAVLTGALMLAVTIVAAVALRYPPYDIARYQPWMSARIRRERRLRRTAAASFLAGVALIALGFIHG